MTTKFLQPFIKKRSAVYTTLADLKMDYLMWNVTCRGVPVDWTLT